MNSNPLRELILNKNGFNSSLRSGVENLSSELTLSELKQSYLTVLHQLVLLGLWRSGFFEKAAFYGGTALSLVHLLDRFSEDLDFSLLATEKDFSIDYYLEGVRREMIAWGIEPEIIVPDKKSSGIKTAFIKTMTLTSLKSIGIEYNKLQNIHRNEKSSVKIEIDTLPPIGFQSEFKYLLNPIPFSIRVMKLQDLYAGKMHALIGRKWKSRIKGRDWYDFIWFQKHSIKLNIKHLEAKLKKSMHLNENSELTLSELKQMLKDRIESIDFEQAKTDVVSFVKDPRQIENWSQELFMDIAEMIMVV